MFFFLVLCFAAIIAIRLIPYETSPFLSSPFVVLVVVVDLALALPRPRIRQGVTWFHSTQNKTKTKKNPIRQTKKKLLLFGVAPFFFPHYASFTVVVVFVLVCGVFSFRGIFCHFTSPGSLFFDMSYSLTSSALPVCNRM